MGSLAQIFGQIYFSGERFGATVDTLPHRCYTAANPLLHGCDTAAAPLLHGCDTIATWLFHDGPAS